MRRRRGRVEITARPQESQLQRPAVVAAVALVGRQRTPGRTEAFGFRLLVLDILALEPSGQRLQYPTAMNSAHDSEARGPALDVAARRARLEGSFRFAPGPVAAQAATDLAAAERAARGLWRRDPAVWSSAGEVQQKIANRLGWLSSPQLMSQNLARVKSFADGVKRDRFTDVVLLGMGGSSLAPEVLRAVLGGGSGWPRLQMLDSTDPAAVRAVAPPLERTLFILASKSGTTIEPNSLAAHFRHELERAGIARWSRHFLAITDEGTALASRAHADGFREAFINPSDIGGRYSAISYFGLVPAALMGQDVGALVGWALAMLSASMEGTAAAQHDPAVGLGLAIAAAARAGRDKLTLLLPRRLEPLGLWIEQLIAESTGKEGVGVVPISGEPLAAPASYGDDRLFVHVRFAGEAAAGATDDRLRALEAGAPLVTLEMAEPAALGAEFVRWQIATAVAGAVLGINPFDEPNVQQAKDATRALLERYQSDGVLAAPGPDQVLQGTSLTASAAVRKELKDVAAKGVLQLVRPGDYVAVLAYLGPDPAIAGALQEFRVAVRDRTGAATMTGYGPRYLHSTGQLHKGGPNSGVFIVITATPQPDVPIPGEPYSFGTLELAQGFGDFASLDAADRRALHVHLAAPEPGALRSILDTLLAEIPRS